MPFKALLIEPAKPPVVVELADDDGIADLIGGMAHIAASMDSCDPMLQIDLWAAEDGGSAPNRAIFLDGSGRPVLPAHPKHPASVLLSGPILICCSDRSSGSLASLSDADMARSAVFCPVAAKAGPDGRLSLRALRPERALPQHLLALAGSPSETGHRAAPEFGTRDGLPGLPELGSESRSPGT